ncbi:MAG: hypothetical protein AAGI07_13805 [Bacteroidota bacterium]
MYYRLNRLLQKIKHIKEFEYWPYGVFYIPLYFYGFYLAFKSRSLMYFSATNPGMKYGGVMGESKIKVLEKISAKFLPKTVFVQRDASFMDVIYELNLKAINFPVIAKPNIGERGKGVEKIESDSALKAYLQLHKEDIIIQEFIEYPLEIGVLYYRYPHHSTGHISSVVLKEFLEIKGDGKSTLAELIQAKSRAKGRHAYLKEKYINDMDDIVVKDQSIMLEPIGNHCRGTKFLNGNHLINDKLKKVFDQISREIEGYYYGRFDLKVKSLEDLYEGKNIRIMELNGVSSEPAHIYDPKMKLWHAYRDLLQHALTIQKISAANHKLGVPYTPLKSFLIDLKKHLFPTNDQTRNSEVDELKVEGLI